MRLKFSLNTLMITIGCVMMVIGFLVEPAANKPTNTQNTVIVSTQVTDDTSLPQPTAITTELTPTEASPASSPQQIKVTDITLDNVVWQDSFDDTASGWEPLFKLETYVDDQQKVQDVWDYRFVARNGYDKGNYTFYLPGTANNRMVMAPYLWDFNPTYRLPSYPYRVRTDISVVAAGNAALFVDYVGDYADIEKGEGIAVVWGHSDGMSYKYVNTWNLGVYEYRYGQTWELGCSQDGLSQFTGLLSTAVVDVDVDTITVQVYSNDTQIHQVRCSRVFNGDDRRARYLGIGAIYPRALVPTDMYNSVLFEDIYVMSGRSNIPDIAVLQPKPDVTRGCFIGWEPYDTPVDPTFSILDTFDSRSSCPGVHQWSTSDVPSAGPERLPMPDETIFKGYWNCGGSTPSAKLSFGKTWNDITIFMGDTSMYVFYARDISNVLTGFPQTDADRADEGYVVIDSSIGVSNDTYRSESYPQIGDGIGLRNQHFYFFTFDGDQILTNWTAQPCRRE